MEQETSMELNESTQEAITSQTSTSKQEATDSKFDMLLDIDVSLTIELGSKKMKIKEVLKLGKNAVIELDKAAGDPLDVRANGNLIARGEVVVVNDKYGIRLTDVVNKSKKIIEHFEG